MNQSFNSPTCEIVTIGSELLLGQILDTNTAYLAQELGRIGVSTRFRTSVGDDLEEICQVIGAGIERCDLVITTGGLGPTLDDLTREAIAQVVGVSLEYKQNLMDLIQGYFDRAGYQMPENNRRQAYVPVGSEIILNPVGTAPCFVAQTKGTPIICLPGVPRELHYLWEREVSGWIRERFGLTNQAVSYRVLKVAGLSESRVDSLISDLVGVGNNPEVGLLASPGEIQIRITASASGNGEAQALIGPVEAEIRARLGNKIFGVDDETLEGVVDTMLCESRLTLAILETFSGGLAAQRLHRIQSPPLLESRVIPDRERLRSLLGEPIGQVDIQTASSLAHKLIATTEADVALCVLGFPEGSGSDSVINASAAVVGDGLEKGFSWQMGGDFGACQQRGAVIGLNTLRLALLEAV